ncbi:hypothetical protein AGMMS50267_04490 [Spirochaetia bacterium]|nr:hypothetical protein AGMMS50267_04490 [Spirochaetia bacterium]
MKINFKGSLVLLVCFVFSQNIIAQENIPSNNNLLEYYNNELFKWDYNAFGEFKLTYQDQGSTLTFGINKNMVKTLKLYPDTTEYYESYRKKNVTGNILLWSGFGIAMGGLISAPIVLNENTFEANYPIVMGVALGGLIIELIGSFILPSGYESLFNSVNLFNRHKIAEYNK